MENLKETKKKHENYKIELMCPVRKFVDKVDSADRYIRLADYIIENECKYPKKYAFSNHILLDIIPMRRYQILELCISNASRCCDEATKVISEESSRMDGIVFYEKAEKDCGLQSIACCECKIRGLCDWDALSVHRSYDMLNESKSKYAKLKEKLTRIHGATPEAFMLLDECDHDWDRVQEKLKERC